MRDLTIKVSVDNSQAKPALRETEQGLTGLEKAAGGAGKATDGFQKSLGGAAKAAAAWAAVASVGVGALSLAQQFIEDADALKRLSERIGVGVEQLQRLRAIGDESGNSIEQLTSAISQLQNRIVEGDKGAVGAIRTLGLSIEDLRALDPAEQFMAIARAVQEIPDPMVRTKIAMDLFGKTGATVLPSLLADVNAIAEKTRVMSEESVQRWDDLGDTITRWGRNAKTAVGEAVSQWSMMVHSIKDVETSLNNLKTAGGLPTVQGPAKSLPAPLNVPGLPTPSQMRASDEALKSLERTNKKLAESVSKAKEAQQQFVRSIETATTAANRSVFTLNRYGQITVPTATSAVMSNREALLAWVPALDEATGSVEDLQRAGRHTAATLVRLSDTIATLPARTRTAAEAYRLELDSMGGATQTWSQRIGEFFTNIPKSLGAIQESLAGKLTSLFGASPDSVFGSIISGGLNFIFGPLAGQAVQIVQKGIEALGKVAWAGLKKIGGWIRGLFGGPSGDELAGRELVADFEQELDGLLTDTQRLATGNEGWKNTIVAIRDRYLELGLTEAEALRDTERLWASSREGAEAAMRVIEEIRRKFEGGITIPVRMDLPDTVNVDPQFGRTVDLPTFHDGGVVARRPVVTAGLADDEVLVLAQRGEGVINREGMGRLGASGLAAINGGLRAQQDAGGDTTINLYVSGYLDSPESARHLGRVVQRQFDQALQRRRRVSLRS